MAAVMLASSASLLPDATATTVTALSAASLSVVTMTVDTLRSPVGIMASTASSAALPKVMVGTATLWAPATTTVTTVVNDAGE